jgi:opacity protein-like surface antigen
MRRALILGSLILAFVVSSAGTARAQGFIAPFIGFNFGGDSQCPTFNSPCENKSNNFGVAFGKLGAVGFEAEFGYARNFFGDTAGVASNLLTFTTNLLIAPKIGPVRPYLVGGVGLIKTRVEALDSSLLGVSNNNFGYDLGGGLMVHFGDHVGVRGDLRRFKSFDESGLFAVLPGSGEKITFNRAYGGLVLSF